MSRILIDYVSISYLFLNIRIKIFEIGSSVNAEFRRIVFTCFRSQLI